MLSIMIMLSLMSGPEWIGAFDGAAPIVKTPDEQCEETVEFSAIPIADESFSAKVAVPTLKKETAKEYLDRIIKIHDIDQASLVQKKTILRGGNPVWCTACPPVKRRFAPGSHPQFEVNWTGGEITDSKFYPCIEDPETGYIFWKESLDSWDRLIKEINIVREMKGRPLLMKEPKRTLNFGTIQGVRDYVDMALKIIGKSGSFSPDNEQLVYSQKWFLITVPEKMRLSWSTQKTVTRLTSSPNVSIGAFGMSRNVSAIVVDRATWSITFEINGFPDGTFHLE